MPQPVLRAYPVYAVVANTRRWSVRCERHPARPPPHWCTNRVGLLAHYKALVKERGEASPIWYRFAGGVCAQELLLRYGDLFMMSKKPDGYFKRKDFEQSLQSALASGSDVVCSDRLGYCADWLQEKIRPDPRCIGRGNGTEVCHLARPGRHLCPQWPCAVGSRAARLEKGPGHVFAQPDGWHQAGRRKGGNTTRCPAFFISRDCNGGVRS